MNVVFIDSALQELYQTGKTKDSKYKKLCRNKSFVEDYIQIIMATNDKPILPAVATHPGRILKKELQARGIKQKDFAEAIGMPPSNLSELIKGKRNITIPIAIKLEEKLGISYQNWMNLQNRYQYVKSRKEVITEIQTDLCPTSPVQQYGVV